MTTAQFWSGLCGMFILYAFRDWTPDQALVRIPSMALASLTAAGLLYLGNRIEVRWRPRSSTSGDGNHG